MSKLKLTLVLTTFACALSAAMAPAYGDSSRPHKNAKIPGRVLKFPHKCIGSVYIFSSDPDGFRREFLAPATDEVKVPAGFYAELKANYEATQNLALLKNYKNSLEGLALCDFPLSDEELAPVLACMQNLLWLDLSSTDLSDKGLSSLKDMKKLQFLNVSRTNVTGTGLGITKNLPELRELVLKHNQMLPDVLSRLADLKHLRILYASNIGIGDDALPTLKRLPSLGHLQIQNNLKITNRGIAAIVPCSAITTLDISDTSVTVKCIESLKRMKALRNLLLDARTSTRDMAEYRKALPNVDVAMVRPKVSPELFLPLH